MNQSKIKTTSQRGAKRLLASCAFAWCTFAWRTFAWCAFALCAAAISLFPETASAQQEPIISTGVVRGSVVDAQKKPLAGVEIRLISIEGAIVQSASTDSAGRFVLRAVPAARPFLVLARKIGIAPAQSNIFTLAANDTLSFAFHLDATVQLSQVEITAPSGGSKLTSRVIRAGEFNPKHAYSVLDMLRRFRPKMFGDAMRCPAMPGQYHVQHVYINGVQRDRYSPPPPPISLDPMRAGDSVPISPEIERVLDLVKSEDVAEVRYVDCTDKLLPPERRNALYITLKPKPLSDKEKKRIFENAGIKIP